MQRRVRGKTIKRLSRQVFTPILLRTTPCDSLFAVQARASKEQDQSKSPKILSQFSSEDREEVEEEEPERRADGATEGLLGPRSTSKMSGSAVEKTSLISSRRSESE